MTTMTERRVNGANQQSVAVRCVCRRDVVTVLQSRPWVGLTHGSGWVEIFQFLVGWVGSTTEKVLKI